VKAERGITSSQPAFWAWPGKVHLHVREEAPQRDILSNEAQHFDGPDRMAARVSSPR